MFRETNNNIIILDYLMSTKSHPTAKEVYYKIKEKCPKITLATVHRNLQKLNEQGKVNKLDVGDGNIHYDADISEHAHFICDHCGSIIDIELPITKHIEVEGSLTKRINYQVIGTCKKCLNKK